jgi:aspartyl-tRNA(Asn)/glutamyl-tRNA(Gln) amidotransferase subunit B
MRDDEKQKELGVAFSTKSATNFVIGAVRQIINEQKIEISEFNLKVPPRNLAGLINELDNKTIVSTMGASVLKEMLATGKTAEEIIKEQGLEQVSDENSIEPIVQDVINNNAKIVADYKGGKEAALQALIGLVMRQSKGKSNPQIVRQILIDLLK